MEKVKIQSSSYVSIHIFIVRSEYIPLLSRFLASAAT